MNDKIKAMRDAFFRTKIPFPPAPASTYQIVYETKENRLKQYLDVTETMSGQDLHHRFGLLGVLVDVSAFRDRHTALKKLVELELKKGVLVTEWVSCEFCGQRTNFKHCRACKGIPEIRALLPKDFEDKRHILSGYAHNGPFCLQDSDIHELNPANGSMRQYLNLFVWKTHEYDQRGPFAEPKEDKRPPCKRCKELNARQRFENDHQIALALDRERDEELRRLAAIQQKKELSQQVCIGCGETFKKLSLHSSTGTERLGKHAAFNTLRLCGRCLSAIQAIPEFGAMLQVLLDSAKERGLIKTPTQQ